MIPALREAEIIPQSEPQAELSSDAQVRRRVLSIVSAAGARTPQFERRAAQRYPFPRLIRIVPLEGDGVTPCPQSYIVVGKHLSERGLGFFHPEPLPHRRVIATLDSGEGTTCDFVLELSWCRFTHHGWYESGGRFVGVHAPTAPSGTELPNAAVTAG